MNINVLTDKIISIHNELQGRAKSAINISLTVRNWLIGNYIIEYEQNGSDRAKYGEKLLFHLSKRLKLKGLKNVNEAELRRFRIFHNTYQHFFKFFTNPSKNAIRGTVSHEFNVAAIRGTLSHVLDNPKFLQTPSKEFSKQNLRQNIPIVPPNEIITNLSFSHFVELIKIKDDLRRTFYEVECIKGIWSVRELKRQIGSLYYERSGLSVDKEQLSKIANLNAETQNNTNRRQSANWHPALYRK